MGISVSARPPLGQPLCANNLNYLLKKATHGGPQASEGLMGIPVLARPPLGTLMPELFLLVLPLKARTPLGALNLVLLACLPTMCHLPPHNHCISSASSSTTARSAKNSKNRVQLVFHNGTFFYINSSWTNDPIWHQRSWATHGQVMACCLISPSHYLNQCWLLTNEIRWHSPENTFTMSAQTTILYRVWKIIILKLFIATFPRGQMS